MVSKLPEPIADPPLEPVSTLFGDRFEQGSEYRTVREKGRSDWLMLLTLAGVGRVASALDIRQALPGALTVFPPGAPQDYATDPESGRWVFLWVHFNPQPHWLPWLEAMVPPRRMDQWVLSGGLFDSVVSAWEEAILHVRRPHPTAPLWSRWAFERVLLLLHDSQLAASEDGLLPVPLARAVHWGGPYIDRPFRLADWAKAAGISGSRLSHLAKEHLSESLQRYAEKMKLQHAAQLLRLTQLRVQEIAPAVGYEDPFYFSTRFRRHYGISPRRYRG